MWPLTFLHSHPTVPKSPLLSPHAPWPRPPHALLKKKDTQHAHILKWFTPLITHATQPLKTARKRPVTAKRLTSGAGGCDG
jgi:hypothetical protein